jgi:hypothetical protein
MIVSLCGMVFCIVNARISGTPEELKHMPRSLVLLMLRPNQLLASSGLKFTLQDL